MTQYALKLFGPPRIERDGEPISVDTRKALAMVAYLALTPAPHLRDALAAFLWPENDNEHARAALRRTLSVLTTALGRGAFAVDRQHIDLADGWVVDAREFGNLVERARNQVVRDANCTGCQSWLTAAVALYRQDFMAGFSLRDSVDFDDWQFFQAEQHRQELANALEHLVDIYVRAGEFDNALPHARRWLALDNLHEPAHRRLMQLYAWTGQDAAAVRQYRECIRVLREELGVSPLAETTQLYQAIVEHRTPPAVSAPSAAISSTAAPALPGTSPAQFPMVGREAEWTALHEAYAAIQTDGRLLVIAGEPGVGKTRLATEFLETVRRDGGEVMAATCYEGEAQLAYAPYLAALRGALAPAGRAQALACLPAHAQAELGRLLPELAAQFPATEPGREVPGAQTHLLEAISQALSCLLAGSRPGILFLDDVQWADEASVDVTSYLVRRLAGQAYGILLAWRSEDVNAGHRLQRLLGEARRAGRAMVISLERLPPGAVSRLVHSVTNRGGDLDDYLYRETEGLPFFLVEYLTLLAGEGGAHPTVPAMPASVRDLLEARLERVSETSRQVLAAAAVIGRSFDFDTVRLTGGRSEEETVAALETLISHGLVNETPSASATAPPLYDFSHEKVRSLVYEETSLGRRRLLHRRVAEAIAVRQRREQAVHAAVIAHHFELAGELAQAAQFYRTAGEYARSLYANAEALAHFRAALALGHPRPEELHEAIGDLLTLAGDYGVALKAYAAAAAFVDVTSAASSLAHLEHKLGGVYQRRGDWRLAERHYQAALDALGADSSPAERARIYADWSLSAHQAGALEQAQDLAGAALILAETAADARALAQTHNLLGILANDAGRVDEAYAHLQRSLALAETFGDPVAQVAALNNLALGCDASGNREQALALTTQALALCATLGDRHREAALHNHLADLLHAAGRDEEAMSHLKQAVKLFAEIGEEGDLQPAIWRLVAW